MINHARGVLIVLCGLLVIESVDGAYMLRQWNPSILTSKYILYPDQKRIVILQGDTQTFKFEAYDTATGEPAEIDEIYSNSMGQIHFEVAGDPYQGRTFGASDLKSIHLPHAGSKPVRIRISGD